MYIVTNNQRAAQKAGALHLAERDAADAGCQESVLFVRDANDAAQALYKKCGYRVLRQTDCGSYMIKQLP